MESGSAILLRSRVPTMILKAGAPAVEFAPRDPLTLALPCGQRRSALRRCKPRTMATNPDPAQLTARLAQAMAVDALRLGRRIERARARRPAAGEWAAIDAASGP
jgi:hypothetical protein